MKTIKYKSISPYCLVIENPSKKSQECILFGENKNLFLDNHGSGKHVNVKTTRDYVNYPQMVKEISNNDTFIDLMRITLMSDPKGYENNGLASELEELTLRVNHHSANGQSASIPFNIQRFYKQSQNQKDVIDVILNEDITPHKEFYFILPPETKYHVEFFPLKKQADVTIIDNSSVFSRFWKRVKSKFNF